VLLVHGVGNATAGDYADLVAEVRAATGEKVAVYTLFYDVFNDWFADKFRVKDQVDKLKGFVKQQEGDEGGLGQVVAEFVGDVMWPMFSIAARRTVKEVYLAQLHQIVLDGLRSNPGKVPGQLKLSIICHSLGCFHTYEVLHAIATDPELKLTPVTDGIRFRSVVFMASPVQLIRSLAQRIGGVVPEGLATTIGEALAIPSETSAVATRKSVRRWVSVTGDLDPIGGHFFRKRADWAFMNLNEPEATEFSFIDQQRLLGSGDERASLREQLQSALDTRRPPDIKPDNPHSWLGYVRRHREQLPSWLA
jgi:hypothetical protein